ncbi:MAG: phosphoglycerate kinase, partial [Rhodobacteraceae bacterium]|nr:phosphoglycerate kinase [Paracoccaceae bacterium]
MPFKTLDDLDLADKRALVRVDINVPMQDGRITDDTRMRAIVPTIREILDKGGKPILLAHFGRPKGQMVPELSLKPLAEPLAALLGSPVTYSERPRDPAPGETVLVENTRFAAGEEKNDPGMAQFLASCADVYVNDAFSAAHRAHASTEGVARLLPAAAGRLMQTELEALEKALAAPERPVIAVVGGAKISTKLDLLGNLVAKVDQLVIGGGMANTFLAATGLPVGKSLCEHDLADTARAIMAKAEAAGCEIVLPIDIVVATEFKPHAEHRVANADACPPDMMILDAGP